MSPFALPNDVFQGLQPSRPSFVETATQFVQEPFFATKRSALCAVYSMMHFIYVKCFLHSVSKCLKRNTLLGVERLRDFDANFALESDIPATILSRREKAIKSIIQPSCWCLGRRNKSTISSISTSDKRKITNWRNRVQFQKLYSVFVPFCRGNSWYSEASRQLIQLLRVV